MDWDDLYRDILLKLPTFSLITSDSFSRILDFPNSLLNFRTLSKIWNDHSQFLRLFIDSFVRSFIQLNQEIVILTIPRALEAAGVVKWKDIRLAGGRPCSEPIRRYFFSFTLWKYLIDAFRTLRLKLSRQFPDGVNHAKSWFYKWISELIMIRFSSLFRSFTDFIAWKWSIFRSHREVAWEYKRI
jgi:hypothetical protein